LHEYWEMSRLSMILSRLAVIHDFRPDFRACWRGP
jgi:hypothetical protein